MQKLCASFSPNLVRILRFSTAISPPSDFLPSYLVNKFVFSPDKAAKAAKRFPRRVCSPVQPDSVVDFFKSNGFDDSHLKKLFSACPQSLALSVEETLVPRFHTFHELGFKDDDLITLVCSNPYILKASMENQVVPGIKLWRSILGSHSLLMKCLTRSPWQVIIVSLQTTARNISILQECGLSYHQITKIVTLKPSMITQRPELLNELIARVERLRLPRGSPNFHWALYALSKISEDNIRAKLEFFKGFGWSEDDFCKVFCKAPFFLGPSLKSYKEKMEFLVKEARCLDFDIRRNPVLLCYSLDKRLKPRVAILKALKEKGLSCGDHKLAGAMGYTKKMFFEKFVAPYEKEILQLSELFKTSS